MKGLVAGYASSGDEASSSDDEPAKPPRAAVREGPRAGRRESRWAIQARAILPPDIRAALEGGAALELPPIKADKIVEAIKALA